MREVIKKMFDQVPGGFHWLYIFLPARLAKSAQHFCLAIEAIFFFPFFKVAQRS